MSFVIGGGLLLISLACQAQEAVFPRDSSKVNIVYVDVVEVKNKQSVLFKNAQDWIAKSYGSYKSVVQLEDKESGKLILKGISPLYLNVTADQLVYTMTIDCRDSKYRTTITDLEAKSASSSYALGISIFSLALDTEIKKYESEQNKRKKAKLLESINQIKVEFAEMDSKIKSLQLSLKQAMAKNDDF